MKNNQTGIAHLGLILTVIVLAVIGFAGYNVYKNNQDPSSHDSTDTIQQTDEIPQVNNADDLEAAEDYVNSADVDGQLNTTEVDSSLSQ